MKIQVQYIPSHWEVTEWYTATYRFGLELLKPRSSWTWEEVED